MRRGDLKQHCENGPGYCACRAMHGVLQPAPFSAPKFHLTQRKHLPSNSTSGGAGGMPCSRGSLASRGIRSRGKVTCAGASSRRDSPQDHRAPGLASLFLAGPSLEPSPAKSLTGCRAHERPEQRVDPVPSGVGNNSRSSHVAGGKKERNILPMAELSRATFSSPAFRQQH